MPPLPLKALIGHRQAIRQDGKCEKCQKTAYFFYLTVFIFFYRPCFAGSSIFPQACFPAFGKKGRSILTASPRARILQENRSAGIGF